MANGQLSVVIRHLRRMVDPHGGLTDTQLLERFVAQNDQTAFEVLLWRHGPMVLGLCRRLLHGTQDVEDAFQATFVALVRKARAITKREAVGSWLYKVAYRVAVKARSQATRRARHERQVLKAPENSILDEPTHQAAANELQQILDEELNRLSDKYRAPLVLCYLEGRTHEEAARELGWARGTISNRLNRAREVLRNRLLRRGVTLSAGGLIAGSLQQPVSAALVDSTIKAGMLFAAGKAATVGGISASVVALTEGVLQAMLLAKLKVGVVLVFALSLLAASVGWTAHLALAENERETKGEERPTPVPLDVRRSMPETEPQVGTDQYGDRLPAGAIARMGTIRFQHGFSVTSVAFSPDGKMLASGEQDNRIHLWEVSTGKELAQLHGDPIRVPGAEGIDSLAFSPDGTKLVAGGPGASTILLWEVATGRILRRFQGQQGRIFSVAYSPDNQLIASGAGDQTIRLWDVATGMEVRRLGDHEGWVRCVTFSPDGKLLASCSGWNIRLWEVATGRELRKCAGHRIEVNRVAFTPDGQTLVSGSDERTIRVWDVATGRERRQIDSQDIFVYAVACSPDGQTLASGGLDSALRLWDLATGKQIRELHGQRGPIAAVTFSPDGKLLASAGGDKMSRNGDRTVRLWDVATGKEYRPADGHQHAVVSVAFSGDGRTLATGSQDGTLRLWDVGTGKPRVRLDNTTPATAPKDTEDTPLWKREAKPVRAIALSPDGKTLATVGPTLCLRDSATGKELARLGNAEDNFGALAFSGDGKLVVAGGLGGWSRIWEVATGKEVCHFLGGNSVSFAPDGKTVASSGRWNRRISFWEVATGKLLRDLDVTPVELTPNRFIDVNAVVYSPDGKTLAVALAAMNSLSIVDNIYLLDARTGEVQMQLKGHFGQVSTVVFSPDGRMLASASGDKPAFGGSDGTIRLWEVATGQERACFRGHQSGIAALAFAPDGRRLASAGQDNTALVWDATRLASWKRPETGRPSMQDLESWWRDLARADSPKAHAAIWMLVASPEQSIRYLQEHLRPVEPVDPKRIAQLLAELDSNRFEVRQKATQELEEVADLAESAIWQALHDKPGLEMRQRLEQLLEKTKPSASPERLRIVRALEALEHIGTPEAQGLLKTLTLGAPEARLTREAKASVARLAKRSPVLP
jgi:RNA polymerase sigma factor (sigma-70 family)